MNTASGFIRGGATALGITVALLGLGGCKGSSTTDAAGTSASTSTSATPAAAPSAVLLPSASGGSSADTNANANANQGATATPVTAATSPSGAEPPLSSIPPSATPTPCPLPEQFFVNITAVGLDAGTSLHQIVAAPATALCGGGLEDDTDYTVTGPAVDYDVSPAVKITGMDNGGQPFTETWAQFAAGDLSTYGGFYGIDVNGGVEVTVIDEYFHP